MTVEIKRSSAAKIHPNFDDAVEIYRQALLNHRFAAPEVMGRVARPEIPAVKATPFIPARGKVPARPASPGKPGLAAVPAVAPVVGTPRPATHPVIESCIRRIQDPNGGLDNFVADYKLIDD